MEKCALVRPFFPENGKPFVVKGARANKGAGFGNSHFIGQHLVDWRIDGFAKIENVIFKKGGKYGEP